MNERQRITLCDRSDEQIGDARGSMLATASQAFENVYGSSEILLRHRELRERATLAQGGDDARTCAAIADFSGVWGSAHGDVWVVGTAQSGDARLGVVVHWDGERWERREAVIDEPTAISGSSRDGVWMVSRRG